MVRVGSVGRFLFLGACILVACAREPEGAGGRAGLVIVHGDGSVQTACVELSGTEARGYEVLQASEFEEIVDPANSMGVLVCSVDGEGCAFPVQDCLCECRGPGSCTYWSYFTRAPGQDWVYSPLGASAQPVHDGDLEGWAWLSGTSRVAPEVPPLPDLTFEEICPSETVGPIGSP